MKDNDNAWLNEVSVNLVIWIWDILSKVFEVEVCSLDRADLVRSSQSCQLLSTCTPFMRSQESDFLSSLCWLALTLPLISFMWSLKKQKQTNKQENCNYNKPTKQKTKI